MKTSILETVMACIDEACSGTIAGCTFTEEEDSTVIGAARMPVTWIQQALSVVMLPALAVIGRQSKM